MNVLYEGKMWEVLENHGMKDIGGITYKILTIKKGRKTLDIKIDAYNGYVAETSILQKIETK